MNMQFQTVISYPEKYTKQALQKQFSNRADVSIFPVNIEKFLSNYGRGRFMSSENDPSFIDFKSKEHFLDETAAIKKCPDLMDTLYNKYSQSQTSCAKLDPFWYLPKSQRPVTKAERDPLWFLNHDSTEWVW